MKTYIIRAVAGCILLVSGCASYKKNFQNTSIANIGYFTDNTISMLSGLEIGINREDSLLVRRFIDKETPEKQVVSALKASLRENVVSMTRYSITIVNIADAEGTEEEKVQHYADYLVTFQNANADFALISSNDFETVIQEIREQTELLEAFRKAQPLMNQAVKEAVWKVSELIDAINILTMELDHRIDEDYADIIRYMNKLEREKFDILTAFELIYDAHRMDEPELSALRDSRVIWYPEIIPEGTPTKEDLTKIGEHLHKRLLALNTVQEEIKPNWDRYISTHQELDLLSDRTINRANHLRIILLTWTRAHQKMASGIIKPAEWFDLDESIKVLAISAPKALL
jgi:hypothetical protein